MGPTGSASRKRGSSAPPAGSGKRQAVEKSTEKNKNSRTVPLSTMGFSASKRPQFNIGTKILLDDTIYEDGPPETVMGHLFVYVR